MVLYWYVRPLQTRARLSPPCDLRCHRLRGRDVYRADPRLLVLSSSVHFLTLLALRCDMHIITGSSFESNLLSKEKLINDRELQAQHAVSMSVGGQLGISIIIHTCASGNDGYSRLSMSPYMNG